MSHSEVVYEPEIHAFGGADAMALAHNLFHADSRHICTTSPSRSPAQITVARWDYCWAPG
ncbi:MAG: lantibiotic dehydratase C-terminal domain-containing protein [Pseudonocardiaceae bacterium]